MGKWLYNGKDFDGTEEFLADFTSFVYRITNLEDNRIYFGKKRLRFIHYKQSLRRKNRIKVIKESGWKDYWGSNDNLKADIERLGEERFLREILRFCRRLSEANYYELKYQMENDVLLHSDRFYNSYVGSRISRKQLGIKEATVPPVEVAENSKSPANGSDSHQSHQDK